MGIPNHGNLRIGDTLTEGEDIRFARIPSFAPELYRRVRPEDPMRAKHLGGALEQMAEEEPPEFSNLEWAPTGSWEWLDLCNLMYWQTELEPNMKFLCDLNPRLYIQLGGLSQMTTLC